MGRAAGLLERCALLAGVRLGEGAFAPGPALWLGNREIAHVDADGLLDVRLTRAVIRRRRRDLATDGRVVLRRHQSDWVAVRVGDPAAVELAVTLIEEAVVANRLVAHDEPNP